MLFQPTKAGNTMPIDTSFPYATPEDAIDKINAERSKRRIVALSAIALALFITALTTYLAYA
jgi:hypothetical protein